MNEQPASLPPMSELLKNKYTVRDWLTYYYNIWLRNATARTIDVENDREMKSKNGDEIVDSGVGTMIPVKERLEKRKIDLQDALDVVKYAADLLKLTDEELAAKWTPEALKIDEDMMPPKEIAGNPCVAADGKAGTWKDDGKGNLLCIPDELAADKSEVAPEAKT